jgi:hypothetical protein
MRIENFYGRVFPTEQIAREADRLGQLDGERGELGVILRRRPALGTGRHVARAEFLPGHPRFGHGVGLRWVVKRFEGPAIRAVPFQP